MGTVFINAGTAGAASFTPTYGQNRRWPFAHAYSANRVPIFLKAGDSTGTWTATAGGFRPSNASTANSLVTLESIAEEIQELSFDQQYTLDSGAVFVGIGWNSTGTASGFSPQQSIGANAAQPVRAYYLQSPSIGVNVVTSLEKGSGATVNGTEASMILAARWRA